MLHSGVSFMSIFLLSGVVFCSLFISSNIPAIDALAVYVLVSLTDSLEIQECFFRYFGSIILYWNSGSLPLGSILGAGVVLPCCHSSGEMLLRDASLLLTPCFRGELPLFSAQKDHPGAQTAL